MNIPNFKCKIIVNCEINPSEEFDKVSKALNNIFPSLEILEDKNSINLISEKLDSLENIFEYIHSTNSQKTFLRNLDKNLKKESLIYLETEKNLNIDFLFEKEEVFKEKSFGEKSLKIPLF